MADIYQTAVKLHKKHQGKLEVQSRVSVKTKEDLSWAYTPGVAEPCRVIHNDEKASFDLTLRGRTMAVISDGSAVLGLGNIGAAAAMPVMEGKALLMKEFAGVDCVPLVIDTQETEDIIRFVKQVAPSFAGINLEDISAPRCFEIEEALQDIGIPVFHDDQHGTAIVVTAALHNATKVVGKKFEDLNVVVVGAGAAGIAISKMLLALDGTADEGFQVVPNLERVKNLILVDSKGAVASSRTNLNPYKQQLAEHGNNKNVIGTLASVIKGADVVIGVSGPETISKEMVASMNSDAIVMAMANPVPEILPDLAKEAGAAVVATGRSDYPNQINNVLAFPGVFKAVRDGRLFRITMEQKIAAAKALAKMIKKPTAESIIPDAFAPKVADTVAKAMLSVERNN